METESFTTLGQTLDVATKSATDAKISSAKAMSGGIIALIIISIIFLAVLVGFLAAFIQRRMDLNVLRKGVGEAVSQPTQSPVLARSESPMQASNSNNAGGTATNAAGMNLTQQQQAQMALMNQGTQQQQDVSGEMLQGPSPPLANNEIQQGIVSLKQGLSTGFNLSQQSQPSASPGILTPAGINPQRYASATRAMSASLNENAVSAATGSCLFKPSGAAFARAVQNAVNVAGDASSTTAENQVRAVSGVVQAALVNDPSLARLVARASGSIDPDAIVTEAANDGHMVDLNAAPGGDALIVPTGMSGPGSTISQVQDMDITHEVALGIKGVSAQAAERDNYGTTLANFAPQSSTMSQQMLRQKMINDQVLRVMACKNPQYAAQILEGVGASQPVTFAGVKTSMSMRPLMYPQISRPPKNDGEFIDAALRPPLVLPIISTGEGPASTNYSVSQAKISQGCTQASLTGQA